MNIKSLIFFLLTILLYSCGTEFHPKSDEIILARVQDDYLLASEITSYIPKNILASDSVELSKSLIKKWVDNKILLQKAKQNLTEEDLNFDKQLEEYKNSLIIYKYQSKLLYQNLDTVVDAQEIKNYFENNKNNFILDEDLIKINFIILSLDFDKVSEVRKLFFYNNKDKIATEEYCKKNNLKYYLEDKWFRLQEIKSLIPLNINSISEIKYKEHEFKDADFMYFIKIIDTRKTQEIKPLCFVKNDIQEIIIDKRKQNLLKKMHEDIFEEGIKKNKIEIY